MFSPHFQPNLLDINEHITKCAVFLSQSQESTAWTLNQHKLAKWACAVVPTRRIHGIQLNMPGEKPMASLVPWSLVLIITDFCRSCRILYTCALALRRGYSTRIHPRHSFEFTFFYIKTNHLMEVKTKRQLTACGNDTACLVGFISWNKCLFINVC